MKIKVINKPKSYELEKRFYMPGTIVEWTCPECNAKNELDLSYNYFSYPEANSPFSEYLYCVCEAEIAVKFQINIELKLVK